MNIGKIEISKEELELRSKIQQYLPVKMSEIRTLVINLKTKDGKVIQQVLHPRKTLFAFNEAINDLKSSKETSFLSDYLMKSIIFALGAKTALTDGSRIIFCPLFAQSLLRSGDRWYFDNAKEKLDNAYPNLTDDSQYNVLSNQARFRYIQYIITHECYHVIYMHVTRTEQLIPRCTLPHERYIANIAADLEINRDIEATLPRFQGCTVDMEGIWYLDKDYLNPETNQPFNKDVFEYIYKVFIKNINGKIQEQISKLQNKKHTPTQVKQKITHSDTYKKGWDDAHNAIQNKLFNPMTLDI